MQLIGKLPKDENEGTESTFVWKPVSRNIDSLIVTGSGRMSKNDFINLADATGANIEMPGFLKDPKMAEDFILADGAGMDYTLRLTGHRHLFQDVHDETKVAFS